MRAPFLRHSISIRATSHIGGGWCIQLSSSGFATRYQKMCTTKSNDGSETESSCNGRLITAGKMMTQESEKKDDFSWMRRKAQIPLCPLPRDVRDKPVTRYPQNFFGKYRCYPQNFFENTGPNLCNQYGALPCLMGGRHQPGRCIRPNAETNAPIP